MNSEIMDGSSESDTAMSDQEDENSVSQNIPEDSSQNGGFHCTECGVRFAKRYNRDRHFKRKHNNIMKVYDCTFCGAIFRDAEKLRKHRESHSPTTGFVEHAHALRKSCIIYRKTYDEKIPTLENAFAKDKDELYKLIDFERQNRKSFKLGLIYHVDFIRLSSVADPSAQTVQLGGGNDGAEDSDDSEVENVRQNVPRRRRRRKRYIPLTDRLIDDPAYEWVTDSGGESDPGEGPSNRQQPHQPQQQQSDQASSDHIGRSVSRREEDIYEVCMRTPSVGITRTSDIWQVLHNGRNYIQNRIDDFIENGSGWRVEQVVCCDVEIGNCSSLSGNCNLISIEYQKSLEKIKQGKNDNKCFLRAIAFHFLKTEDEKKLEKFIKKFFIVNIPIPVEVRHIKKFEKDNFHLDLKIQVIFEEGGKIFPLLFSNAKNKKNIINLILYKTEVNNKVVNHYSYIKNIDKFLRRSYKKDNKCTYEKSIRCLNCFAKF